MLKEQQGIFYYGDFRKLARLPRVSMNDFINSLRNIILEIFVKIKEEEE